MILTKDQKDAATKAAENFIKELADNGLHLINSHTDEGNQILIAPLSVRVVKANEVKSDDVEDDYCSFDFGFLGETLANLGIKTYAPEGMPETYLVKLKDAKK